MHTHRFVTDIDNPRYGLCECCGKAYSSDVDETSAPGEAVNYRGVSNDKESKRMKAFRAEIFAQQQGKGTTGGALMNARTIPTFPHWQTYAGGTSSPSRYSYHVPVSGGPVSVHGSPGMYMVDPVAWPSGKHRGYRVLFCDAGGELISRGVQGGLYREICGPVTLPEARRAVAQDFALHFWPRADVDFWHPELPEIANCAWLPEVGSFATGSNFMAPAGNGHRLYAYVWTPLPA